MSSVIYEVKEGDPNIQKKAVYSLPPKAALVAYIMQYVHRDWNTGNYPETLDGMHEGAYPGRWYYALVSKGQNTVVAAYPCA